MNTLKNPSVILTLCLVIGGIFLYKNFLATPSIDDLTATTDITSTGPGRNVVDLYNRLQSVNFDTSVFKEPPYAALMDFSTPLEQQPIGRPNPFDKI